MSSLTPPSVEEVSEGGENQQAPAVVDIEVDTGSSLEALQTTEQRQILDTVAQVRKCGLDTILQLPQIVVCGDQSAGKSSVLEALTEIPFPRNDNLCTRFATEIILRPGASDVLTIKIIPDDKRHNSEQAKIKSFHESITNFDELPRVMDIAMSAMGINESIASGSQPKAFARDVLSIEIEGPKRPQLTLVDIPGLIHTETKGQTKADVDLVTEITDQYISQQRTICLAVVSAANDYANQKILAKVREVDPDGNRTLGIITKPDIPPKGSGTEKAFISLALNEDIFFKLGWHVLKNRKFEESAFSLDERNLAESTWFSTSNFNVLPEHCRGVDTLRTRLSQLLFEHVKSELPQLRSDLELALVEAKSKLDNIGNPRSEIVECKDFLAKLSLEYHNVCKAAVDGHYEGGDFAMHDNVDQEFSLSSPAAIRRIRAAVQYMNEKFAEDVRLNGHKYHINVFVKAQLMATDEDDDDQVEDENEAKNKDDDKAKTRSGNNRPIKLKQSQALDWARRVLKRTRGQELVGNFNPLLVGELFWEQCCKWEPLAKSYLEDVAQVCRRFLQHLLREKCPTDVASRLQEFFIQDALNKRHSEALEELGKIMEDIKNYPINYNHYYTDTIYKRRLERQKESLRKSINSATRYTQHQGRLGDEHNTASINVDQAIEHHSQRPDANMENVSCEEALDCLYAIYKVSQKIFVANITTQVVERHLIRGLEAIFSPTVVNRLKDAEVEKLASEPDAAKRHRIFLNDRIKKLEDGQKIFRKVMGSAVL
ncbi:hypothetical protein MMC21_002043 [Puttea exsequens]|nr:hypothetical protein [Puttea exsequens]